MSPVTASGYRRPVDGNRESGHLRGAVLAALCTLIAAVGHTAGGGSVPDLGVLVVLSPLLAGMFTAVAQRCHGPAGTIAVLGAGQLALHHLMELLHPAHHMTEPAVPAGWRMVAMHAVATLVTAVALRYTDRALSGLTAALRRVVRRRLAPLPADRPLLVLATPDLALPARLARALAAANITRGPPVGC
jgi:hypothetical protein